MHEPHACYCSGPQNGDPLCPCRMRETTGIGRVTFAPPPGPAIPSYFTTPIGWLCPKCNQSNAPTMPTCFHCAANKGAAA